MQILIALTYYRPHYSGLTIYAEREARALARRGHQVTVLTSRYSKDLAHHEYKDGVEIVRLNVLFRVSKGVIMPSMPLQAWKLISNSDIVHLHIPQLDAALIALESKFQKKPLILTYHCDLNLPSGLIHQIANKVSNWANIVTASLADRIVVNTRDYAENSRFLKKFLGKIQPIYPPVEIAPIDRETITSFREKFSINKDQKVIGMASRLAAEKGVEYLAQALPHVLLKVPEARVIFVGPYRDIIGEEQYAKKLSPLIDRLGHHWTYVGILSPEEMAAFFKVSDVVVLPSINSTESYGIVQVESFKCGTPVVATDLPGVRVPVQTSGMGRIIKPGDPIDLADALVKIIKNPTKYAGDPAELLSFSTPEFVARSYEKIFMDLIHTGNGC
ncbi:MAG: glycosyltransferase family 4 protein [Anaerolineales bacterium]|jgi:glycosyltransferase involved in cell wall biosynthesis